MKNLSNFGGGNCNAYLKPMLEVTSMVVERGFEASLPGLDREEGEGWGEY
ncbi:MAG: hypothetical protein IJX65_03925 [Alistipes sp.]|nr:hypothetical protein [Alistipes sp.]